MTLLQCHGCSSSMATHLDATSFHPMTMSHCSCKVEQWSADRYNAWYHGHHTKVCQVIIWVWEPLQKMHEIQYIYEPCTPDMSVLSNYALIQNIIFIDQNTSITMYHSSCSPECQTMNLAERKVWQKQCQDLTKVHILPSACVQEQCMGEPPYPARSCHIERHKREDESLDGGLRDAAVLRKGAVQGHKRACRRALKYAIQEPLNCRWVNVWDVLK